jgi:hypothetical protein
VALQVGRQIRSRGVGVVAADRVQDVDAVMGELVGRHGERVLAIVDQPALHQVVDVGELDPAVTDRAPAEAPQEVGSGPDLGRYRDRTAGEQTGITIGISAELDLGSDLGVPLD